jgi:hypothetical protein
VFTSATDQDRTDAVFGEQFRRGSQIRGWFNSDSVAAQVTNLGGQNRFYVHGSLPRA